MLNALSWAIWGFEAHSIYLRGVMMKLEVLTEFGYQKILQDKLVDGAISS